MVYHEKFKVISIEGHDLVVHVVDHLNDEEILEFYQIALEKDEFEYAHALAAEAITRNLKL